MRKDTLRRRASKRQSPRLGIERLETRTLLTTCTGPCADLNLDGHVDFDDFTTLATNYGANGDWSQGDITGDGRIDFADFLILSANFDVSVNECDVDSPRLPGEVTPGTESGTGSNLVGDEQGTLDSTTENGTEPAAGEITVNDAPGGEAFAEKGRRSDDNEDDDDEGDKKDDEDDDDERNNDVLRAARLIKEGKIYSLSQVLDNDSPTNPFVAHELKLDIEVRIPESANNFTALAETIHSNFMHVGTQFDAIGHIGIGDQFFGGHTYDDIFSPSGLLELGVEEAPPFFARGVLVDVARYKGVEMLPAPYEITLDDLKGALKMQRTRLEEGDVVLFNTGWGLNYTADPVAFVASQPGIGVEVAQFLAEKEVAMVGADNVFVEVFPNPIPSLALPVHQELLTKNGIHLIEIVKTDELAKDRVYEFAFVFAPILVRGATGSAAHPIAII